MRLFHRRAQKKRTSAEITPEEILLDASNLPEYSTGRLEGRLVSPVGPRALRPLAVLLIIAALVVLGRAGDLMAVNGATYKQLSENNRLGRSLLFAERGLIYDRNGVELAWNVPHEENGVRDTFDERAYATTTGLAHVLGYVRLPARDANGVLYRDGISGVSGVELSYDDYLRGDFGTRLVETDARMHVVSESILKEATPGKPLHLTIDTRLQTQLYDTIAKLAERIPFTGGAGVIMDVHTGEILALTSYPEYDPNALVSGNRALIAQYATDPRTPYLDRVVDGQYTPGSIVKPYIAVGALTEGVVNAQKTFVSTGALRLANPFDPGTYSVFTDWRPQGIVDLRRALAVSSNVYFYIVGGGFGDQEGLGIDRIDKYMQLFGFGMPTNIALEGERFGVIPSPAWKATTFPNDPEWRIGDTYHTAIGQYGVQVTPIQVVRAVAALANGGNLLTPRLETDITQYGARQLDLDPDYLATVRGGMRDAVLDGTAKGLNVPYMDIAAKTGTAELGVTKDYVNSWVTGFYPYENPHYAFVVLMEHGPRANELGGVFVMRTLFDWMRTHLPEYLDTKGS